MVSVEAQIERCEFSLFFLHFQNELVNASRRWNMVVRIAGATINGASEIAVTHPKAI